MAEAYHPGPVPEEVLEYFRAKGWKIGFDYRDVWQAEHAHAFTVAKVTELDLLEDIREAVDQAMENGETFARFRKQLEPLLREKGWWGIKEMTDPVTGETVAARLGSPRRLKTIYRVNMKTARAAGQWDRAQRTKAVRPYLLYSLGPSRVHRKKHLAWNQLLLPIDHDFWLTHYPPNGWGCKCRVRQISKTEAKRLGGVSEEPVIRMRKWKNKRTGETQYVPQGIDPGWDYNPGTGRGKNLSGLLEERYKTAHPADADAAKREWNRDSE
ncbi:MAG: hypothetical protein MI863_16515 [Desulfobacterales bacterium]|nr:hypothetical protein [Desulfobacterales bacterium]